MEIPSINNPIQTDDGVCHFVDADKIEVGIVNTPICIYIIWY